jgi:hypothetical protein
MCRNIKSLFNFDPPATDEEIREASLQYVRKLSGYNKPSKINEEAFNIAIDEVSAVTIKLLKNLKTDKTPKNRDVESEKKRIKSKSRFG